MERLFTLLEKGGKILSKNSVDEIIWKEGLDQNRTFINETGSVFIYIPDYEPQV